MAGGASKKKSSSAAERDANMAAVYQAFLNAGFSTNQARALTAEVGRENGFRSNLLWGSHSDPANRARNVGMFSWQSGRDKKLLKQLQAEGLLQNGRIVRGQASLDVMAKFARHEMETIPAYRRTKNTFLKNPNVDYNTAKEVLGRNYIRWAYDDNRYASGHKSRDTFYNMTGKLAPAASQESGLGANVETTNTVADAPASYTITKPRITTPRLPNGSGETQFNILSDGTNAIIPTTKTENNIFGMIAGLGLDGTTEGAWAAAASTIAALYDEAKSKSLFKKEEKDPLTEVIADLIEAMDYSDMEY